MMSNYTKILLEEDEIPTQWYNVIPDLPEPPPPALHPATYEPATAEDFAPLFPMALVAQEVSEDRYIDIPGEVLDVYRLWRPTPLYRARRLEKMLDTPAKIFYKYEGVSPAGSHKPNTAVPQVWYNAQEGITKLTTETGAGQWGSSLAFACAQFGVECEVWQVAASYRAKPHRRTMMEIWGGKVHPSPSEVTEYGRKLLAENPDHPGSLGIAISEAVSEAMADEGTRYALGSVLNHVLLHQTVIGEEALLQLAKVGETPDVLVGCTGGGSNFGGLAFPFLREKLAGKMNPVIRCVEPTACPTLTKGEYRYDFGDTAGLTPLMKMHTLGHGFIPEPIHAGGLRYHGMAPLVSHVYELGLVEAISIPQLECFSGAIQFARAEGIVPAPEPTHAIAAAVREALACRESGESKTILTALCGHGHLDLASYDKYLHGEMQDLDLPQSVIDEAMRDVPDVA
jgi:tryptophan synthase beta chain